MLEFMRDYDKLRSGRIPATSFRRALDLCGFGLGQDEVTALEAMCVYYTHTPLLSKWMLSGIVLPKILPKWTT